MRMVNEFNAPGVMAPAHFLPRFDDVKCTFCGNCAKDCPMGALVVDLRQRGRKRLAERCIGCGLCVVACGDRRAVAMEPVPDCKLPYKSWFSFLSRNSVPMLHSAWKARRTR